VISGIVFVIRNGLLAVCDGQGRPVIMLLSEGQMNDYKDAALTIDALPPAKQLLGDKGYNARLIPTSPRRAWHRRAHSFEIQPRKAGQV
jgi:hypothetical protein